MTQNNTGFGKLKMFFLIVSLAFFTMCTAVTAEAATANYQFFELTGDEWPYYQYGRTTIIPCEEKQGIFILEQTGESKVVDRYSHYEWALRFYSFSEKKMTNVASLWQYWHNLGVFTDGKVLYTLGRDASGFHIQSYTLATGKEGEKIQLSLDTGVGVRNYGVDAASRIYISGTQNENEKYPLYLFSKSGELLSRTETDNYIYRFDGFDSTNGNFYVEEHTSKVGYYGAQALNVGNVKNNTLTYNETYFSTVCTGYWNDDYESAGVQLGKYLVIQDEIYSNLYVLDSNSLTTDVGSWQPLLTIERTAPYEYESVGVNALVSEERGSIIAYIGENTICEYALSDGSPLQTFETAHPVWGMWKYGDYTLLFEMENNIFYVENVLWKNAGSIQLSAEEVTVPVRETVTVEAETDSVIFEKQCWTSADPSIASVSNCGEITGWHPGETTVTVSLPTGVSATVRVRVTGEQEVSPEADIETQGAPPAQFYGENADAGNYWTWSSGPYSYLYEDGSDLVRVEEDQDNILVERYTGYGKTLKSSQKINRELDLFGGFFSGKDGNYLVFGQKNENDSDDVEVIRVVKYDKNWKRSGSASIKGADTYFPFNYGALRMDESDSELYIHTCHVMYASSDGVHHQSNMTIVLNKEDMTGQDIVADESCVDVRGYTSHSFNQFVKKDGQVLYMLDHGDAYPRAVKLTKIIYTDTVSYPESAEVFTYRTEREIGENYTGASIGGFEVSKNNCLFAGNEDVAAEGYVVRNVFVTIVSKDLKEQKTVWFTDFAEDSETTTHTPALVKLGDHQFLLMWDEYTARDGVRKYIRSCAVTIDEEGNRTSEIVSSNRFKLSDCQPILCKDGNVRWYVTEYIEAPVIFALNPYRLVNVIRFKDVMDKNSWYYDSVYWAVENGVTSGMGEGTFQPMAKLTRAQTVMFLYKLAGKPDVSGYPEIKFTDVTADDWYYSAVRWAVAQEITTGYGSGTFRPSVVCNRAMIVTFLMRYSKMVHTYKAPAESAGFKDVSADDWYSEAVDWAVASGVTSGYGEGTFQPQVTCNRAMMVTFLKRVAALPVVQ